MVVALSVTFGFAGNGSHKTDRASITINQTNLILPSVIGLTLTTDHSSKVYQYFASGVLPSNKFYACYTTTSDLTDSQNGGLGDRGCQIESLKSAENILISPQYFEKIRTFLRGNFEKNFNEEAQNSLNQLQSQIEKSRNTKGTISLDSLKLGQTTVLETLSDDNYSYTTLIAMKIIQSKDGTTEETPRIGSCATLMCKGKVIYFFASSKLKDSSDVDWVKQVTKQWMKDFIDLNEIKNSSKHLR